MTQRTTSSPAPALPSRRHVCLEETISSIGFYRAAWLIVATGGWWSTRDVLRLVPLEIDIRRAHNLLWCMAHRYGYFVVRGERRSREYAVTADCEIPGTLKVGAVVEAVTGQGFEGAHP